MSGRRDLFLAFAIATCAHAGVLSLGVPSTRGGGGGETGVDRLTITAAAPEIAAMVHEWNEAPETFEVRPLQNASTDTIAPPEIAKEATAPRMLQPKAFAAKQPAASPPELEVAAVQPMPNPNVVDQQPIFSPAREVTTMVAPSALALPPAFLPAHPQTTPPVADLAPPQSISPRARPNRLQSSAVTRRIASGIGEIGARGENNTLPTQERANTNRQAASAAWAAEIQRRISRHHVYPRGSRDEGRVRVAMVILPTGRLTSVSIERSSGSVSLDRAALDAVKRAAPFPPAPDSLNEKSYNVGQWITFERR